MKYALESRNYNAALRYAKLHGLEVRGHPSWEMLSSQLQAAYPDMTEFELDDDGHDATNIAANLDVGSGSGLGTHYHDDPKVLINISSDDENGGKRPVPVCVNGDFIWIARNLNVPIPYRFYVALRNALQTDFHQEDGPNHTTLLVGEERYAYRFNVLESPPAAEIAAWQARTKDLGRDKAEIDALKPKVDANDALAIIANALTALAGHRAAV
jgi:hypothetical protein